MVDLLAVSVEEVCRGDVFTAVLVVLKELGVVGRTEEVRVELGVVGRGPGDWCLAAVARLMCDTSPVVAVPLPSGVVLPDRGSLGLASWVGVDSLPFLVVIVVSFRP